jgi:uncharacterized cupin superfamily protein
MEARLERITHGVAPVTDGWFVVNAADAQWIHHPDFGWQCPFEANGPVVRQREDIEPVRFPQVGVNISVLARGKPKGLYHREDQQEDFLVLRGECLARIEGDERRLRQWDFLHCAPGTAHVIVGTGERPSIVIAVGARGEGDHGLRYPLSESARKYKAGSEVETSSPQEAYAGIQRPVERRYRDGDLPEL